VSHDTVWGGGRSGVGSSSEDEYDEQDESSVSESVVSSSMSSRNPYSFVRNWKLKWNEISYLLN